VKFQPYRKHVANHSEQRSQSHLLEGGDRYHVISYNVGQQHSRRSFCCIEQKRKSAQHRRFAGHIRRPDVSAAALSHIFTAEDPYQQIAEGNRSQQVT